MRSRYSVPPVLLGGGRGIRQKPPGALAAAQLHPLRPQRPGRRGQIGRRDLRVDQKGFDGVAHRRILRLPVHREVHRHLHIRRLVHVEVADAVGVAEDGDARILLDEADELVAPPGDEQVDGVVPREEGVDILAGLDELEAGRGDALPGEGPHEHCREKAVGLKRLLPPLEDAGVSGLQAERGNLGEGVGARLEDGRDHPDGTGDPAEAEALVEEHVVAHPAERIGKGGHRPDPFRHLAHLALVQDQAVEERAGHLSALDPLLPFAGVFGIRGENLTGAGLEGRRHSAEGAVPPLLREGGQGESGLAGRRAKAVDILHGNIPHGPGSGQKPQTGSGRL